MSIFTREQAVSLLEIIGQETKLFEQIYKLTEEQAELVSTDEIEAFSESLDRRQELMEKINGLHQEYQSLMQSYISYYNSPNGKKVKSIEQAEKKLRDLITASAELNDKNTLAAQEKADSYKDRIGKLSISRKSIGSYIQAVGTESELFDKKM